LPGSGRRTGRRPPILVGLALALVLLPLAARAERALVVFGSGVTPEGAPSRPTLRRLETALELARQDPRAPIVVTGGAVVNGTSEGPAMARWLVRRGVSPGRILVESRARHTGENADFAVPLLRRAGASAVTVVTERYHARRARFHMRAALREAGMGKLPVTAHPAPDNLRGLARVGAWMRESAKIVRDSGLRLYRARRRPAPALSAGRATP
jgi:uncharacterized SAM-binding protein YcdF (DUF218 family)